MGRKGIPARKPGDPLFGITRIDSGGIHCWYVRLYEGQDCHSKTFSDGRYGGKRKALRAAKAWRDEVLAGIEARGVQRRQRGRAPTLFSGRSSSGVDGVKLRHHIDPRGYRAVSWAAEWHDRPYHRVTRTFSVRKYGYRGAFLWAAYTRAKAIGEEIDLRKLITPPPPDDLRGWLDAYGLLRQRVDYRQFNEEDRQICA